MVSLTRRELQVEPLTNFAPLILSQLIDKSTGISAQPEQAAFNLTA